MCSKKMSYRKIHFEKIVEITLKLGKYPVIQFVDKESYLNEKSKTLTQCYTVFTPCNTVK
jgi:stage III sporulation protein SpoIIIAA